MANRNVEKLASIDAQLRLLVPAKVSDDDKLVEYGALSLDFLKETINSDPAEFFSFGDGSQLKQDVDAIRKKHDVCFFSLSNMPLGPSDGDKAKNTGNDESVGFMSIAGALTIENSNGVSIGNTTVDLSGISEAVLSGISEAVLGIGKQILKVVEDGMNQFLTLISKLVSSSLGNRHLKRCINKIK